MVMIFSVSGFFTVLGNAAGMVSHAINASDTRRNMQQFCTSKDNSILPGKPKSGLLF
jgi:hypothetical protein